MINMTAPHELNPNIFNHNYLMASKNANKKKPLDSAKFAQRPIICKVLTNFKLINKYINNYNAINKANYIGKKIFYPYLLSYKKPLKILLEFPSVLPKNYALYQLNLQGHRYSPEVLPFFSQMTEGGRGK